MANRIEENPFVRLSAYIDGEATPDEREATERLLSRSGRLRSELDGFLEVDCMLREWASRATEQQLANVFEGPTPPVTREPTPAPDRPRVKTGRWRWWAAAAAVAAIAVFALLGKQTDVVPSSAVGTMLEAAVLDAHRIGELDLEPNLGVSSVDRTLLADWRGDVRSLGSWLVAGQVVQGARFDDGLGIVTVYVVDRGGQAPNGEPMVAECRAEFDLRSCSWSNRNNHFIVVSYAGDSALPGRVAAMAPRPSLM